MIQCPKCANQLPDWSQVCQFCQADLKGVARPKPDPKTSPARASYTGPAKWIWPTYYAISGYFVLGGILNLINVLVLMRKPADELGGTSVITTVGIIVSSITILIGLGLIFKVEAARGIVNIRCWITIAVSVLSLPTTIGLIALHAATGIVMTIWAIFDIVTAGLMIYLIGETD